MPYLRKPNDPNESLSCRILTAALNLFVQQGFHNISIHEIQRQAQVSIGSIYNHFGGKEGIARALYQHLLNELAEVVDAAIANYPSASERHQRIISELFHFTETHRNMIAFLFHTHHPDFLPDEPAVSESLAFQKLRFIVQAGMQHGEFRSMDEHIATAMLFGSAIHMIQLRLEGKITNSLVEYVAQTVSAAQAGLVPEKSPSVAYWANATTRKPRKLANKLCQRTSLTG